jgi:RES domain-containing protein
MLLYRIGKAKYSRDLTGEGAKLNGGRWNNEGIRCIYTAESRALALLEYTAHASLDTIPRALCFTTFDVPDQSILHLQTGKLPGNWSDWPHSKESRDFGSQLLLKQEFLLLKFPSAIIPNEYNFLINPSHPLITKIKIVDVVDYAYDVRLKG